MVEEAANTKRTVGPIRAALANLVSPGLGYVYVGRLRSAFLFLAAIAAFVALTAWSRVALQPSGLYLYTIILLVIRVFPIIHVALIAKRNPEIEAKAYNRWWYYVVWLVALAVLTSGVQNYRSTLLGYEPFRLPSASMAPTAEHGDFVMTDTWHYNNSDPVVDELIAFRHPGDTEVIFLKRIVGVPGDSIEIANDELIRNGQPVVEPYIAVSESASDQTRNFPQTIIPKGHYFVLGDNRNRSQDSRFIGPIARELIRARVVHRWFAYNEGIRWERFPHVFETPTTAVKTQPGDLLITNARIVDPVSASTSEPSDVLIRNGLIHSVSIASEWAPSANVTVRDASGLFLHPGLIDVHAHIGDGGLGNNTQADREAALAQFVRYGVTSIFVPGGGGGNNEQLAEWKQFCAEENTICPDVFGSGNIITAYGSHPITTIWGFPPDIDPEVAHQRGATGVKADDDISALIANKAALGVDALKIVVEDGPGAFAPKPRLSKTKVEELCNAAHTRGLRVYAHVSLAEHVDDVVAGGCDGIMHAPDDEVSETTLRAMADGGVFYVATLSLLDALLDQEAGDRSQEAYAIAGVSARALESLNNDAYWDVERESPEIIAAWDAAIGINLQRAAELGVPIALGTDTNNPGIFPGYSAHEELALMTHYGLTEQQALTAATTSAAEFLEHPHSLGKILPGYEADMIALRRNPLDDITNTRALEFVIADGLVHDDVVSEE